MESSELTPLIEALLFAAGQPLTVNALAKAVKDKEVSTADIKGVLDHLEKTYDSEERGFQVVRLGSGYQVVTRPRYEPWVKNMLAGKQKARLSRAGLETVSVVAYKQPITRLEIERIRGVDVGGVLNTLLERNLVMIKGRDPGPGRPLLYGTTATFLNYFGIARLSDLPQMEEIAALAQSEVPPAWDEAERARFERHGVDPDAPLEEDIPPDEAELFDTGNESALEAGSDIQEDPEVMEEEREIFQEVAADFASSATTEEEPQDPGEAEPPPPSPSGL